MEHCRYAGKRCFNTRATKRNGEQHSLCHTHRVRANQNQRRMELKRRLSRTREDNTQAAAHRHAHLHARAHTSANVNTHAMAYSYVQCTLEAIVMPVLLEDGRYSFADLSGASGDSAKEDAISARTLGFADAYSPELEPAFMLQSDTWVVPNFLLTL
ncbi:hypothetical protein PybrP1_012576 [[Pythium] brassicae (nom. inval.)]|nr:hypothetical protein PybrP1_012576 [[Pythium] brassicae (nom. inval.)]